MNGVATASLPSMLVAALRAAFRARPLIRDATWRSAPLTPRSRRHVSVPRRNIQ